MKHLAVIVKERCADFLYIQEKEGLDDEHFKFLQKEAQRYIDHAKVSSINDFEHHLRQHRYFQKNDPSEERPAVEPLTIYLAKCIPQFRTPLVANLDRAVWHSYDDVDLFRDMYDPEGEGEYVMVTFNPNKPEETTIVSFDSEVMLKNALIRVSPKLSIIAYSRDYGLDAALA